MKVHGDAIELFYVFDDYSLEKEEPVSFWPGNLVSDENEDLASNSHDIAFDKAEQAEQVETRRKKLKDDIKQLEADLKEASEQNAVEEIKERIQNKNKLLQALEKYEEQSKDAR